MRDTMRVTMRDTGVTMRGTGATMRDTMRDCLRSGALATPSGTTYTRSSRGVPVLDVVHETLMMVLRYYEALSHNHQGLGPR